MRVKRLISIMESQPRILRALIETLCLIPFSFMFYRLSKWMSHRRSQKRGVACIEEDLSSIVSPNV